MKKSHPVWFFTLVAAGIIIGIAASARLNYHWFLGIQTPIIAAVLLAICLINRRRQFLLVALVAGGLFGVWRGGSEQKALSSYNQYYSKSVTVSGIVNQDTSYGTDGDQRVRLRGVVINQQKLPGIMWLSIPGNSDIKRGDQLVLTGKLVPGFGNFPASVRGVRVTTITRPNLGDVPRRIRDWFSGGIRLAIPEPEASLSVGYLVGQQTALPELLSQQLRTVGLTHAVVASGYNLTILVGVTRRIFAKYSKYLAILTAGLMVVTFVLITGFSPSMTRAGLVSLLGLLAWYYGRSFHPLVLLVLVAAATAIWRPSYVWGDIGWYLSFTAFGGVMILSPLMQRYFWGSSKKIGILRQTLMDTTSAQLLTLPIILYSFGQYASYALLANILVLPLVPLAMLLTFIAGLGGIILPSFAHIIGLPAKLILASNILVIGWVSRLPGASGEISFGLSALIISYVFLTGIIVYLWRSTKYDFRKFDSHTKKA